MWKLNSNGKGKTKAHYNPVLFNCTVVFAKPVSIVLSGVIGSWNSPSVLLKDVT